MATPRRMARPIVAGAPPQRGEPARIARPSRTRRRLLLGMLAGLTVLINARRPALAQRAASGAVSPPEPAPPQARWYEAALAMKQLAMTWGDQPYGAVLVLGGAIAGEGPSRVVLRNDPTAHAEREAIRDAQRKAFIRRRTESGQASRCRWRRINLVGLNRRSVVACGTVGECKAQVAV